MLLKQVKVKHFNNDLEDMQRKQMKIILKITIEKIHFENGHKSRAEDRISELEDTPIKFIQSEQRTKKKVIISETYG